MPIDHLWSKIQMDLGKNELVCRYRSLLQVYSQRWSPIDRAGRIEFDEFTPFFLISTRSFF